MVVVGVAVLDLLVVGPAVLDVVVVGTTHLLHAHRCPCRDVFRYPIVINWFVVTIQDHRLVISAAVPYLCRLTLVCYFGVSFCDLCSSIV